MNHLLDSITSLIDHAKHLGVKPSEVKSINLYIGTPDNSINWSTIAQILISLVALITTFYNFRLLHRINIRDSIRRVNDKYTELNILELENSSLLHLSHLKNPTRDKFNNEQLKQAKAENLMFNHINVAQGIYIEMVYKTMKRTHAMRVLNTMIPPILNDPLGNRLLQTSSYDEDFVKFCLNMPRS